jgi:hypothetical protein
LDLPPDLAALCRRLRTLNHLDIISDRRFINSRGARRKHTIMGAKHAVPQLHKDGHIGYELSPSLVHYLQGKPYTAQNPSSPSPSSSSSSSSPSPSFSSSSPSSSPSSSSSQPPNGSNFSVTDNRALDGERRAALDNSLYDKGYAKGLDDALSHFEREVNTMTQHVQKNELRYVEHIKSLESKLKELSD